MATKKISELTNMGPVADNDLMLIVDVDDLTQSPQGTTKKVTKSTLAGYFSGPQGPAGAQGIAGIAGATWFIGTGTPNAGTGANNDLYLDIATGNIYRKNSGAWGSPLGTIIGPQGAQGAPGNQGQTGIGVPAGGTAGQVLGKNSNTDYDTGWITPASGGSSGVFSVNTRTGAVTLDKTDVGLANVNNTSDASKPVSTAQQAALDAKEPAVSAGTTSQYYRGDKTFQTLNKAAVGLGNVDNTADTAKPVSTAQQSALDAKAPIASPTFTGTVSGITKGMVGLGNVDNTSDASKPVSTATQTALNGKSDTTHTHAAFVGSGASHAAGFVPDPGSTAGTTRYLREDGTFAVPPSSGSSKPHISFKAVDIDSTTSSDWTMRNGHKVTNVSTVYFSAVLPTTYGGNGLTVEIFSCTATDQDNAHQLNWQVAFDRLQVGTSDLDSNSFATAISGTAQSIPNNTGIVMKHSVVLTNAQIDGLLAGEAFQMQIVQTGGVAGVAQIITVNVRET